MLVGPAPLSATLLPDPAATADEPAPLFARPTGPVVAPAAAAFAVLLCEGAVADWSAVYLREDLAAGLTGSSLAGTGAGAAVTGFVLLGTGISVTFPALLAHAGAAHPGPALAAVSTGGYTGFLVGPTAIGGVAELAGPAAALWLLPALAATAGLLVSRRRRAAVAVS